jgi:hypothetical protein
MTVFQFPDYSDCYQYFPFPETVTFFSKTSETVPTTGGITVENALREVLQKTMVGPGGSLLRAQTVAWHLPNVQLNGLTVKFGDVIADLTGNRYTVSPSEGKIEYDGIVFFMWRAPCILEQ